jgi:hypothetical protein
LSKPKTHVLLKHASLTGFVAKIRRFIAALKPAVLNDDISASLQDDLLCLVCRMTCGKTYARPEPPRLTALSETRLEAYKNGSIN